MFQARTSWCCSRRTVCSVFSLSKIEHSLYTSMKALPTHCYIRCNCALKYWHRGFEWRSVDQMKSSIVNAYLTMDKPQAAQTGWRCLKPFTTSISMLQGVSERTIQKHLLISLGVHILESYGISAFFTDN